MLRGIEKICTLCKNHNIPNPEYTVHGADIMMMFKATESGLKSSEKNENVLNQGQNVLNTTVENGKSGLKSSLKNESSEECGLKSSLKNEVTIISAIEKNSCITIPDLQNLTRMSRNGVKKVLNRLRSKGIIRREGPDKGGKWIVLKSGD